MTKWMICLALLCGCRTVVDGKSALELAVTDVVPALAPSNGGTEITLTGHNFADGAMVKIGTTPALGVVRHDSTRLTFVMPALPIGSYPVEVDNPDGALATGEKKLRSYASQLALADSFVVVPARNILDFLVGDITGDGFDDLVVGTQDAGLSAYLNRGDGSFGDPIAIEGPADRRLLLLVDLDRDGASDLVDASGVRFSRADGSFTARIALDAGIAPQLDVFYAERAAALDVDGDGTKELALFAQKFPNDPDPNHGGMRVFHVTRDAATLVLTGPGILPGPQPSAGGGFYPHSETPGVADLDGDGIDDLVLSTTEAGIQQPTILRGPAYDPTKSVRIPTDPTVVPLYVGLQDTDGDGRPELVVIDSKIRSYPIDPTGLPGTPVTLEDPCGDNGIATAAFVGPSAADDAGNPLFGLNCLDGQFWTFRRAFGQGLERAAFDGELGGARTARLDGDAFVDLVYAGPFGITARYGERYQPRFDAAFGIDVAGAAAPISAAYGRAIVAASDGTYFAAAVNGRVLVAAGDGSGRPVVLDRIAVALARPDDWISSLHLCTRKDGGDELIAYEAGVDGVTGVVHRLSLDAGHHVVAQSAAPTQGLVARSFDDALVVADFSGTGRCDVVVSGQDAGPDTGTLDVFSEQADGSSTLTVVTVGPDGRYGTMRAFDLDGDGQLDLYWSTGAIDHNDHGTFVDATSQGVTATSTLYAFGPADLLYFRDDDGTLGAWGVTSTGLVSRYVRAMDGAWTGVEQQAVDPGVDTPTLALVDVNADGILDLIAYGYRVATVLSASATGALAVPVRFVFPLNDFRELEWHALTGQRGATWFDADRDGLPDLLLMSNLKAEVAFNRSH